MISVIVPYYQTEKALFDACANSILYDNNADIELIIVDDGSGAKYQKTCDNFLKDNRVKVFHLPHRGVSYARNYGIDVARGKWLTFVDSDDRLELDWYVKLARFIEGRDDDVILFNGFKNIEGKLIKNNFFIKENVDYGQDFDLKMQVMESALSVGFFPRGFRHFYSLGSPCSKLYRLDFLRKNGLQFDTEVTFAEDTLFALNVYQKSSHIFYADMYLYHYVLNRMSSTQKYRPGIDREMDVFFSKVLIFMNVFSLTKRLARSYYNRAFSETIRAMSLYFFNKKNNKSYYLKRKEFQKFIDCEPYKTGIVETLTGRSGARRFLIAFLVKCKLYSFLINAKSLYKSLKQTV